MRKRIPFDHVDAQIVAAVFMLGVLLIFAGASTGLAIRAFMWASGFGG